VLRGFGVTSGARGGPHLGGSAGPLGVSGCRPPTSPPETGKQQWGGKRKIKHASEILHASVLAAHRQGKRGISRPFSLVQRQLTKYIAICHRLVINMGDMAVPGWLSEHKAQLPPARVRHSPAPGRHNRTVDPPETI
jgi:hypothetical protein